MNDRRRSRKFHRCGDSSNGAGVLALRRMENGGRPYLWLYFILSAALALFVLVVFLKLYLSSLFRHLHKSLGSSRKEKDEKESGGVGGGEVFQLEEREGVRRRRVRVGREEAPKKDSESPWSQWAEPEGPEGRVVGPEGAGGESEDYEEEKEEAGVGLEGDHARGLQRQLEGECSDLFSQLKELLAKHKNGINKNNWAQQEQTEGEMVQSLKAIQDLFNRLDRGFGGNRSGHITAMILCCNVIMQRECLQDLSSCQEIYKQHKIAEEKCDVQLNTNAQAIIEKVVPSIWSS
eukprot:GHVS01000316.1.p1 GENE.GHVS01000316.1~~GHVS01000316.1.p1  ORF type:complete len:291 (+),score=66.74 GHVS01000316.1:74-946(+)